MTGSLRLVLALVTLSAPVSAQGQELIVPEYLAPQYTAPVGAPATIVIAGTNEPGERMVVTGRTLVGEQPVAGVSLYVFHTDSKGRYAPGIGDLNTAELSPRLHGSLRTDAQGQYQYETIRPAGYDNGPAHVHYVVKAPGYEPLLLSLQFEDDPVVIGRREFGIPLLAPDAFKNGPCKSRPDCVLTRPVTRDARGVSRVTRDIQMVPSGQAAAQPSPTTGLGTGTPAEVIGRWVLVATLRNGEDVTQAGVTQGPAAFVYDFKADGTFSITRGEKVAETGVWAADDQVQPKTFDHKRYVNGQLGRFLPGIYEAGGDVLKMCLFPPSEANTRPAKCEAKAENRSSIYILKRDTK